MARVAPPHQTLTGQQARLRQQLVAARQWHHLLRQLQEHVLRRSARGGPGCHKTRFWPRGYLSLGRSRTGFCPNGSPRRRISPRRYSQRVSNATIPVSRTSSRVPTRMLAGKPGSRIGLYSSTFTAKATRTPKHSSGTHSRSNSYVSASTATL